MTINTDYVYGPRTESQMRGPQPEEHRGNQALLAFSLGRARAYSKD